MKHHSDIRKIAFAGDYVPRRCGIATFTHNLRDAVAGQYPDADCFVVAIKDGSEGDEFPPEVRFEVEEQDLDSYLRAADFLNFSNADLLCLQHEYGIFGGPAGGHILTLLRNLRIPVVTTLHTILREPNHDQYRVMKQVADLSARLVAMSARGKAFLTDIYGVPDRKIDVIPHGIPDMPFVDPNFYKDQFGVEGRAVALTFGLLSPNKGIEHVLKALPEVIREYPNFVYIILGATHPNLVRDQGERYRRRLERMAEDLGITEHVIFYNRFVELNELRAFLGAADIYITPYLNPAQITSGALAYAFGCGKAVISTPYWHAEELLADGRGVLVPFGDSTAIAREIRSLWQDEARRHAMRKKAYLLGREMIWSHVAHVYVTAFQQARRADENVPIRPLAIRTLAEQDAELPDFRLDHLLRLTDSTGIFQHACYSIPRFEEGYCTDDNARALLLTVMLEELGMDTPAIERAATTYAAFVRAAFDPERRRFRNFMSFDRRWLEEVGSDDSHGRALWALGACVGGSRRRNFQVWAAQMFDRALPTVADMTAPRAWAFTLLGIHEYLRRWSGDRLVNQVRETLMGRLLNLYERSATDAWHWFEPVLSYDNARLAQALIVCGRAHGAARAGEVGLQVLRWLMTQQKSPQGHFRPVGSNGFHHRGHERAQFDQQPVDAHATMAACLEAYRASGDAAWLKEARLVFDWFLGRNDLGLELYDPNTGGCGDGLQEDRINQNQGAESTLAFLLSLAELKQLELALAAFRNVPDTDQRVTGYHTTRANSVAQTGDRV
jgi:glycosyltransferase involved in cell wall biosynthesis